jgi:MFS transporter, DHA2 family, multidrug resistance protein
VSEIYKNITSLQRVLITLVVMSATLMQVIDTTIVNVALPHMQGALSASPDEITWTLTSYLVASAIFMPLTGYISDMLGRKFYLIISITGFTAVSALCGASVSLPEMVMFRLLQGVFGAALVPLSQAIMTDIFPPEERTRAMAIWGVGVMVGPILGPTLGGYLTDIASWRWTFYVNVPVGIFTLLFISVVPDSPKRHRKLDWLGVILICTSIGGLQYVIDRGNSADWFASSSIQLATYITVASFLGYLVHQMGGHEDKVFDLKIFKDKNFAIASFMLCIVGLGLYGTMVIQPIMMQSFLNYPVLTTGLLLAPRGISGMLSMVVVTKLSKHVDPRWIILSGIIICTTGIWVSTFYSFYIDEFWLVWPMILQGFGMGMIFVPLSSIAFSTLPQHLRTEAAGLYSLVRTIGGSIGISVAITVYTRRAQEFWNQLGGGINIYNPAVHQYLQPLHLAPDSAMGSLLLGNELMRQSSMLAFVNVFAFIAAAFIMMAPLVFLADKMKRHTPEPIVPDEKA